MSNLRRRRTEKYKKDPLMCRIVYDENEKKMKTQVLQGGVEIGGLNASSTIQDIIEEDKRYGKMEPYNGKYFTVKVMDWQSRTITNEQLVKGVIYTWLRCEWEIGIDVRLAKEGEYVDFKVYFRVTTDDPDLTRTTVMYHYYPINDFNDPRRGMCVVNVDWPQTIHGEPVSMYFIDDKHYTPDTQVKGETMDFDAIYFHEGPGHGLGLGHSPHPRKKMSSTVGQMVEHIDEEDPPDYVPRILAKDYPERSWMGYFGMRIKERLIKWFHVRSDKY